VSVRSRTAFAAGAAGLAGAVAILIGRTDGNVGLLLLLAFAPLASAAALTVDASGLARQMRLAPALALIAAAGAIRAGSASFADVRGANAVAGVALARGPAVSVAGAWMALLGGVVALAGLAARPGDDATRSPVVRALEGAGVVALGVLLAGLFAGPQVRSVTDAIWWAGAVVVSVAIVWRARSAPVPDLWIVATALAAVGLVLTIAGGAP